MAENTKVAIPAKDTERWSVGTAVALIQSGDVAAIERYAGMAARLTQGLDKTRESVLVAQSLATITALRGGYLKDGREGVGVKTFSEYATDFGRGSSQVTTWKRLGICLAEKGIEKGVKYPVTIGVGKDAKTLDYDLWNILANKSGVSAKSKDGLVNVGDVIERSDSTLDDIGVAVATIFAQDGKRHAGSGTPRLDTGESTGEGTDADVAAAVVKATPLDAANSAVKILSEAFRVTGEDALTYGEAADLLAALTEFVAKENTLVLKREGAPVTKKAPAKAPAKKSA